MLCRPVLDGGSSEEKDSINIVKQLSLFLSHTHTFSVTQTDNNITHTRHTQRAHKQTDTQSHAQCTCIIHTHTDRQTNRQEWYLDVIFRYPTGSVLIHELLEVVVKELKHQEELPITVEHLYQAEEENKNQLKNGYGRCRVGAHWSHHQAVAIVSEHINGETVTQIRCFK